MGVVAWTPSDSCRLVGIVKGLAIRSMPNRHNAARRHHIPKMKFWVKNWSAYDTALRRRGSLTLFPNIKRWFQSVDERPAVAKARAVGGTHAFKKEVDEETRRALFPSNYPPAAA
jgi:hypothetical protein